MKAAKFEVEANVETLGHFSAFKIPNFPSEMKSQLDYEKASHICIHNQTKPVLPNT